MPRHTRRARTHDARRRFVLAYLSANVSADALNEDFCDRFAYAFGRAGRPLHRTPKTFGAQPCPAAINVLRQMWRDGEIERVRIGLTEHGPGFPCWVNSYSLPPSKRTDARAARAVLDRYPQPHSAEHGLPVIRSAPAPVPTLPLF